MNVFEKMKKSWESRAKNNSGFTLVELIVVIAILAILAGIAVPAYSGYVEKAERAEDEQLLATINTAYAAACIENGVDMADLDGASMPLTATNTVDMVNVQPYKESFATYYTGNEDAAFNVFESIVYSPSLGRFCNIEDAPDVAVTVNGKTYVASGEDVAKVLESTWAKELTAQETLDMVAGVASLVQEGYGVTFTTMIGKDEYRAAAAEVLGLNSVDEYDAYIDNLIKEKYPNGSYPGAILNQKRNEYRNQLNGNIAVLVTAKNAQTAGDSIIGILTTNNGVGAKEAIKNSVDAQDPTTGLSQAALAYGLYNAFIYQRTDLTDDQKAQESSVIKALQNFDDPDFQEYLTGEQGKKDLDGLLASLNVASTQNKETIGDVVAEGVNNADLVNAINQILGK